MRMANAKIHGMTNSRVSMPCTPLSPTAALPPLALSARFPYLRSLGLVRLEADLKDTVSQGVSVQRVNRTDRLVVISHCDKSEAFALVSLQVPDHLHALHGPERTEELPEHVLLSFGRKIVHENAPTVHTVASRQDRVGQYVAGQGRVSREEETHRLLVSCSLLKSY